MYAAKASSHKTVQNPVVSAGQAVDKKAAGIGGKVIHTFPHPLGASNAEGFEVRNPIVYKGLVVFSRDSGPTSTTKLLIYSTFF